MEKEYPKVYDELLMTKMKVLRECPEAWKKSCMERLENTNNLLEDFKPDKLSKDIFRKCTGYSSGISYLANCKAAVYSIHINKALAENQRLEMFLKNLKDYS